MSGEWGEPEVVLALAGAALLLLLELALSVMMISLRALTPVALRRLASDSGPGLAFVEEMHRPPSRYLDATRILHRLCLLGVTATLALAFHRVGLGSPVLWAVVAAALGGVLIAESLLGRAIALWNPRAAIRFTAPVVRLACALLLPWVVPIEATMRRISSHPRGNGDEREEEQDEEVEALIEVGERSGLLEAAEGEMMRGIVDLDETMVREIMTPRTDIVGLESTTPVGEARRTVLESGHSRLPVYAEAIDNVVGVLHSRDLFQAWEDRDESQPVSRYVRPAVFVPETLSAADLLAEMREKAQIAMVVDEYGGIAGLVTLEDVLEEIVGDIRDEHETEQELVRAQPDGSWIVNAVAHVEELEDLFDFEIPERDFDTVGGLVVSSFGRVPTAGDVIETMNLRIEVMRADPRRVQQVRIRRIGDPKAGGSAG